MSVPFFGNQSDFVAQRCQSKIGIVLSEQNPILGPGGKHPVGLVDSLRDKVVDQHADIGFIAFQNDRLLPFQRPVGIDSRHQTLGCSLFITGRTVDLTGKIESCNPFGFERMVELRRRKIVVFDGVSGAENVQILQPFDLVQRLPLHLPGQ